MGLLQNLFLQKSPIPKIRNSGGNHEIIVVSTAKILGCFSKKAILQQLQMRSLFLFYASSSCSIMRIPAVSVTGREKTMAPALVPVPASSMMARMMSFF